MGGRRAGRIFTGAKLAHNRRESGRVDPSQLRVDARRGQSEFPGKLGFHP